MNGDNDTVKPARPRLMAPATPFTGRNLIRDRPLCPAVVLGPSPCPLSSRPGRPRSIHAFDRAKSLSLRLSRVTPRDALVAGTSRKGCCVFLRASYQEARVVRAVPGDVNVLIG